MLISDARECFRPQSCWRVAKAMPNSAQTCCADLMEVVLFETSYYC
jgi:hypothetical protein